MTSAQSQPVSLFILGAGGDLTRRLLLPGLGSLLAQQSARQVRVVGVDRSDMATAAWQQTVREALVEGGMEAPAAESVAAGCEYVKTDLLNKDDLADLVGRFDASSVVYFALPPFVTAKACDLLVTIGVPEGTRLALEKPFGEGSESAAALNHTLTKIVPEDHVFRVDHFMGEATVLNLLGLRFANRMFEPQWNRNHIKAVEVVYDETLFLEGRAGYYDHAGALVDMLQSHLLMVMAMVALEEPGTLDARELRDLVFHTVRATQVYGGDPVTASRRARYSAATVGGRDIPSYVDEPGVDPDNNTETLAEVAVEVRNARWAGVPFILRSGKALSVDRHSITVHYHPMPHVPQGFTSDAPANTLTLNLDSGVAELGLVVNGAKNPFGLSTATMRTESLKSSVTPYGEVLAGLLDNDPLLAIRGDVAEECWRVVEPVLRAWKEGDVAMEQYPAGSVGPSSWARPLHEELTGTR